MPVTPCHTHDELKTALADAGEKLVRGNLACVRFDCSLGHGWSSLFFDGTLLVQLINVTSMIPNGT